MAELITSAEKEGKYKSNRNVARVDLTAMVDLAFLLITFFMLTTTLQRQEAMAIAMPDKGSTIDGPVPASRTLTLCLGAHNKVLSYFGTPESLTAKPQVTNFGKDGLRKILTTQRDEIKAKTGKDMILLVKPSDHSLYDNLVSAIDEANITRINRYAIVDISAADIMLLKKFGSY